MFDKPYKLEIVTPRKVIFSGEVVSFSAPGVNGGFQVLFDHAPLLCTIGIGEVKITTKDNNENRYATSGGFVEVKDNTAIMLAETIETREEIDIQRAENAKTRALKRIKERKPGTDLARAETALQRALNRIRVATKN
ncbi:MAG: F0F1 ATP synthase subunit epsilon [Bacteroidetes bacterium]|nr:F0F1 ATP synthase subunit epsilon [Bacteroidota bacterium]MBU1423223.1 F0F1 ATP synthase subunit epsilon [Bacteroidota bacterium]MBU2472118.1 F0F1 ATP synthase subunit epsilon [Bacteroidota bacterium]MBU2635927.1 F0F1 ATP synthase subunit epsilon [Bacteroidota bacterium]